MTTIEDLHWQAGIFEGEGSVRINTRTVRNAGALLVEVTNTDISVVEPFRAMWGGTIKVSTPRDAPRRRVAYRWRAASREAEAFLLAMWPCLRTDKYRARAVVGLDFQRQKSTSTLINRSPEYAATQLWYYGWMADLNRRGRPDAGRHRRPR